VLLYQIGSGRAFGYDGSLTFRLFVLSGPQGAMTGQKVANNHVLMSLIGSLVHETTGTTAEAVYRAINSVAVGATAGIVVWWTSGWSRRSALAAGAVFATSPLLFDWGRQLRGYALVVLLTTIATLILAERMAGRGPRRWGLGYALAMGLAIGAHLYAGGVLLVHAAVVYARGRLPLWVGPFVTAVLIGLLVNAGVIVGVVRNNRGRLFQWSWPWELVLALGGRHPVTLGLLLVLLAPALVVVLRRREARWALGTLVAIVLVAWAVAPRDLYPRFFVWIVPVIAVLVAISVARHPRLGYVVPVLAAIQLALVLPGASEDRLGNRDAGRLIADLHAAGAEPCILGNSWEPMAAYAWEVRRVWSVDEAAQCDVVVDVLGPSPLANDVRTAFRHEAPVGDVAGARAWTDADPTCLADVRASCW
jgi:hypothetical protein